ncbi:MAG: ATP-binding protein [Promethearchaeota archaeon]
MLESEKKIKYSEDFFLKIVEHALDIVFILDIEQEAIIHYTNQNAVLATLGIKQEKLIGKSFYSIVHPDQKEELDRFLRKTSNLKKAMEIKLRNKKGNYIWLELRAMDMAFKTDRMRKIVFLKEINYKKQIEDKLKEYETNFKEILNKIPEIRFWELFSDKNHDKILKYSYNMLSYIIENIPQLIFWKDDRCVYLGCNDNYAKFIGMRNKFDIIGKKDGELLWNDSVLSRVKQKETDVIKSNKADYHSIEKWFTKDQKEIYLDVNRIPLQKLDAPKKGVLVTYQDITEKKKYENLIIHLNNVFLNFTSDIEENIKSLLASCTNLLNGKIALYIQKNIQQEEEFYKLIASTGEILEFNKEEIENKMCITEIMKLRNDKPYHMKEIQKKKYAKTDSIVRINEIIEGFGKKIDGSPEEKSSICVFFDRKVDISEWESLVLMFISDAITIEKERLEAKQNLEKQNNVLIKINSLKTELIDRTSHELKTPLISIKGFTEFLLRFFQTNLDPEVRTVLKEIEKASNRLENTIQSLLETSKIEQEKLFLELKYSDLSNLINECISDFYHIIEVKNHDLKVKIPENVMVKIDKKRIYEVISNLLTNALKYTPPNGSIKIKLKVRQENCVFSIKDTGIGFDDEEKEILFTKFGKIERYGKGWNVDINGSGLGLYIAKELIELHGGKIWMKSAGKDQGSSFYFSLPLN